MPATEAFQVKNRLTELDDIPAVVASRILKRNAGNTAFEWIEIPAGVSDHAALSNLSFAASGHTDFAPIANPVFTGGATSPAFYHNGNGFALDGSGLSLGSGHGILWSSTSVWNGTLDLGLARSAAGVLEINDGTPGVKRDLSARAATLSTPLSPTSGGTGLASYTVGNVIYATGATTLAQATPNAANLMALTGAQTIEGPKTFSDNVRITSGILYLSAATNYVSSDGGSIYLNGVSAIFGQISGATKMVFNANGMAINYLTGEGPGSGVGFRVGSGTTILDGALTGTSATFNGIATVARSAGGGYSTSLSQESGDLVVNIAGSNASLNLQTGGVSRLTMTNAGDFTIPNSLTVSTTVSANAVSANAFSGGTFIGTSATLSGPVTIGSGTPIAKSLSTLATLNFPSIAAGTIEQLEVTLAGALEGAIVSLGPPPGLEAGLFVFQGRVKTGGGVIIIPVKNETGSAIDPASADWRVEARNY